MRESDQARSPTSRIKPGPIRVVVFDLDGTLIDSLPTIAAATNAVRIARSLAPVELSAVRDAIGDGARVLVGRLFSDAFAEGDMDALLSEFMTEYTDQTMGESDPWRPGARSLLDTARGLGLRLAILSNKPVHLTEAILERTKTRSLFEEARGPENSVAAKPDPRALTDLIEELGVGSDETIFVGDSVVDFETGKAAGVETIGLRGGYGAEGGAPPDLMLESPFALSVWLAEVVV